jgi:hypothetical protein
MTTHPVGRNTLLLSAFIFTLQAAAPDRSQGALAYASAGTSIATFDTDTPGTVSSVGITGLQLGETLTGIDVRPADAMIYGVGSSSRVYTINPITGVAVQIGSSGAFVISGTSFGMDFNPVPDRIRFVGNDEQNLRLNPITGGLAATDTSLSPAANIVGAAYTNNFAGATLTTLYGIDSAAGNLVLIGSINGSPNSPNGGLISTVGSLGLGTNLSENIGFDISGASGAAMATITTGGVTRLYNVNLATGATTVVGTIGNGATAYSGFTFAAVPEPSTTLALAGTTGLLLRRRRTA